MEQREITNREFKFARHYISKGTDPVLVERATARLAVVKEIVDILYSQLDRLPDDVRDSMFTSMLTAMTLSRHSVEEFVELATNGDKDGVAKLIEPSGEAIMGFLEGLLQDIETED